MFSKGPTSVLKMCIWGSTSALNVYQGSDRCTRCALGVYMGPRSVLDVYLRSNKCIIGVPGPNKCTRCCT